jgi:hypothetical protein
LRSLRGSACHWPDLASLGKLGFNAATGFVVLGAGVDFFVEESDKFGEVGGGPALDAFKERRNSRHFCNMFTMLKIGTTSDADKVDAFFQAPTHRQFER